MRGLREVKESDVGGVAVVPRILRYGDLLAVVGNKVAIALNGAYKEAENGLLEHRSTPTVLSVSRRAAVFVAPLLAVDGFAVYPDDVLYHRSTGVGARVVGYHHATEMVVLRTGKQHPEYMASPTMLTRTPLKDGDGTLVVWRASDSLDVTSDVFVDAGSLENFQRWATRSGVNILLTQPITWSKQNDDKRTDN